MPAHTRVVYWWALLLLWVSKPRRLCRKCGSGGGARRDVNIGKSSSSNTIRRVSSNEYKQTMRMRTGKSYLIISIICILSDTKHRSCDEKDILDRRIFSSLDRFRYTQPAARRLLEVHVILFRVSTLSNSAARTINVLAPIWDAPLKCQGAAGNFYPLDI